MSHSLRRLGMFLILPLVCGFGIGAGGLASAGTPGKEKMVVRIGALLDQTGGSTSPLYRAAVELAASQMNQALAKAGGRLAFEIVFGDTKSSPPLAATEAIRLINQEGVQGLVSASSGETVNVNKLNYDPTSVAKRKVPITCFQCSSGFINNPTVVEADPLTQAAERDLDNWLFRVFYIANYEAAVQVQVALKNRKGDGPVRIGIFADGGHRSLATAIADTLAKFSAGSSAEITYFTTLANLGADWEKVVKGPQGNPDLVMVAMLPEAAAAAIKAYRQGGHTIPIQSNNSFRRNYILKQMGAIADGLEGSSVQSVDKSESGEAFLRAFKTATGQLPEMTSSGAYDSTVTLLLAATVAAGNVRHPHEVTAANIRESLTKINNPAGAKIRPTVDNFRSAVRLIGQGKPINYEGAYNSDDWDAVGDIFPPLVHWKVEKQQFVEYELYDCSPQKPLCPVK
jgi:ABC-type branched-subunit amino acid transport system substrate-binding protein